MKPCGCAARLRELYGPCGAFVHIVEQYLTYPVDAKGQDRFAEGLLITLTEVGRKRLPDRAKLLQYAERVWNITEGSEDERINPAITATRVFFERMSVGTRLRDYQIGGQSIGTLIAKHEEHGMTALGEHGDVTLDGSRQVYQFAV